MVEPRRMVTTPSVARRFLGAVRMRSRARAGIARSASILTVLSLLLALLLPAGLTLAQDDEDDGSDDVAATPAASDDSPAGEYTVAITDDDIPQDVPNGAVLIGRWQIFLEPDGAYSLGRADIGIVATGSYTVDGETITITDEDGLLSCLNAIPTAGPDNPVETATYTWELGNSGLTLTPIVEGCQGRGILLSTRPLDLFVACNTTAVVLNVGAEDAATPAASPVADDESDATPELDEDSIPVIENPFGTDEDEEGEDADTDEGDEDEDQDSTDISDEDAEDGIDALLRQLSACWATQDPARIIPLFGAEFLQTLLDEAGSLQDVAGIFGQIMVVPINWERSGPVESDGETFSAIVALTIGGEESFQRYSFVFEDGQWLLDSFGF